MKKISIIAWVRYHRRAELLAQALSAKVHFIYSGQSGKLLQLPIRYLVQTWQTWSVLRQDRPDVIIVQNPPIFCVVVAFFYAWTHRAQYIIDSHTGAFYPPWGWFLGLHRILSRKALLTIVHNESQEKIVRRWGCRYCVIAFTPGDYSCIEDFPLDGQFKVAVISTFAKDEPLDLVFNAASRLADVDFYVSGNSKRIRQDLLAKKPGNCHLTGFLSYGQYSGLLQGADAVLDLTTRDHTLLMGGFEAVSLGTPLITSNWPVLKEYFSLGTVHIPNNVEGICWGVRKTQDEQKVLRHEMLRLREELQSEWGKKLSGLLDLLLK